MVRLMLGRHGVAATVVPLRFQVFPVARPHRALIPAKVWRREKMFEVVFEVMAVPTTGIKVSQQFTIGQQNG
jgi:hypothetical protein